MDCLRELQLQLQPVKLDQKHCSIPENDESDEDDESYIEIVLDHGNGSAIIIEDGDEDGEDDEEYELRISISSTIPIPLVEDQQNLHFHNNNRNHSMEMEMEPMILADEPDSPADAMPTHDHHHDQQYRRLKFPSVSRLFTTTVSLFNLRLLWENRQTATQTPKAIHNDTYNNAKTRKEASTTETRAANGKGSMNVMMKLLIKFPTSKIRKLLASLLKPNTKSCGKSKTIIQCYCYDERRISMVKNPIDRTTSPHGHGHGMAPHSFRSSNKVLEIDLGAIRGMLSAVGLPSISKRTSWSTSSSSFGPSPLHQAYAYPHPYPDDSIQSAVAYCKTSLQQTCQSDFSF